MLSACRVESVRPHRRNALALFAACASGALILHACTDLTHVEEGIAALDFSVVKTGVVSGQTVTYTLVVTNHGPSSQRVTVSDLVGSAPAGSQFTSSTGGVCTPGTGIALSCQTAPIAPGATTVLTLVLTIPPGASGDIQNCASVPTDANDAGNQSCVTNTVIAASATGRITIIKNADPKTAQDFAFTSSNPAIEPFLLVDDSDATLPNQMVFSDVAADTYVITERQMVGWAPASIECSPAGAATTDLETGAATIVLAGSASVTCTFASVAAQVQSITPASPVGSAKPVALTIAGTNFLDGAIITLSNLSTSQTFEDIPLVSLSATQIVIAPVFGIATTRQNWSLEVTYRRGGWFIPLLAVINSGIGFEVEPPTPVIEELTTSEPEAGRVVLTITGSNFSDVAAQVLVEGPGCEPACTIPNGELTTKTDSTLVGALSLTREGTFTVRVQNGAGGPDGPGGPASDGAIFVRGAQPIIVSSITPASPIGSADPQTLTITGANFGTGAAVTLRNLTTAETFAGIRPISVAETEVMIEHVFRRVHHERDDSVATTTESWSVAVVNPSGQSSNELGFEVLPPTPAITGLTTSPPDPMAGGTIALTIDGTNFSGTAVVSVVPPMLAESISGVSPASPVGSATPQTLTITINPVNDPPIVIGTDELTSKSSTRLVASLTLPNPGPYTVSVQNGAGGAGAPGGPTSNSVTFDAAPTVANPGPSIALRNIDTGTEVSLRYTVTVSGIPDTVSMSTAWEIQPVFGIATTLETWSVAVDHPGRGSTLPFEFEVQAPTPAITSISTTPSPAVTAGAAGRTNVITLVGTEFSDVAARVLITGPGCEPCTIENSALTTKTATTLVGSMSFSRAGTFSVSVQNAGSSPTGPTGPQSAPITLIVVE